MSIFHFYEEIRRGLRENYFLYSEQDFMLQEAYSTFWNFLREKGEDMNSQLFDISEKSSTVTPGTYLSRITEALRTPGFFGDRGWTVIKNAQILRLEDFKFLGGELAEDSRILILYNKELPEKIVEVLKNIKFLSVSLRDNEVRRWIEYKAKSLGIDLSDELIQYIEELTEGNPVSAASELQKIALAGIKKPSLSELKELIFGHSEYDSWDLVEAVKKKDKQRALLILREIRSSKKDDLPLVIGALNKFYSNSKDYKRVLPLLHQMDILSKASGDFLEPLLLKLLDL